MIKSTILPSGLRVVTDTVPSVESVALGVWVDVGTRDEDLAHNGVAHMVEHMMFNGTPTRSSQDIAESIERVGGQMNAYTSRELTAYYIHLLKEDTELALDILSDMIQRPTFPDSEVEKERGVIVQEIGMTLDTPDDLVFDLYQQEAYPNQAIGAPILGTANIIEEMKKETLFSYVSKFYTAKNLVISAAGNIEHDQFVSLVERYFSELESGEHVDHKPSQYQGGTILQPKDLEQAHIVLGHQGVEKNNPEYYSAVLLSLIMGGGMASRLFQEVREKRGLAYSIYSSHTAYHDDGQFEIYAGTGPNKSEELISVLKDEIKKITDDPVTEEELNRAKAQLRSGILMGRESMLSRANRQAKYMLNFDRDLDISLLLSRIDAVNENRIQAMAQQIFGTNQTLAVLGAAA